MNQQQAKYKLISGVKYNLALNSRQRQVKTMRPSVSNGNTLRDQSLGPTSVIHMLGDLRQVTLPL